MENSMENIYTDVRVERVNIMLINIKKTDANNATEKLHLFFRRSFGLGWSGRDIFVK